MEKLRFSITIKASRARVWNTLWDDANYRLWAAVFQEGSCAESDWQEGSKILFHDGKGSGMSSKIARLIPNEFMSFEHLGMVKDGVENFDYNWSGAQENYTLRDTGAGTELVVEFEAADEWKAYFQDTFPKALARVKELAEQQKITTFLTYNDQAEAAMNLYCSVFKNARRISESRHGGQFLPARSRSKASVSWS